MVSPVISSNGEDDEIINMLRAAEIEAQIKPMLRALEEPEVVMEPEAEREEPLFMITGTGATGVELSKAFCKKIAEFVRESYGRHDDIPTMVSRICLERCGVNRRTQRGAFAASRYAAAVVKSLNGQAQNGQPLKVNSYWA